jgi:hypothetical protein
VRARSSVYGRGKKRKKQREQWKNQGQTPEEEQLFQEAAGQEG